MSRTLTVLVGAGLTVLAYVCTPTGWLAIFRALVAGVYVAFFAVCAFYAVVDPATSHTHDAEDAEEVPARHVADHTRRPDAGGDDGVLL